MWIELLGGVIIIICSKCRKFNTDEASFCRKCGAPLNGENIIEIKPEKNFIRDNKKLIRSLTIVFVVLVIFITYAFVLNTPLQTQDFGNFSISVPFGSNFVDDGIQSMDENGGFVSYKNTGSYSKNFYFFQLTSVSSFEIPSNFNLIDQGNQLNVYQNSAGDVYLVVRDVNNYKFILMGNDLNTLKNVANSIKFNG